MVEVAEGIHVVDGVNGNSYLVLDGDTNILVDTGLPRSEGKIERYVRGLGVEVSWAVLTHCHVDHVGGAAALRSRLGLKLAIGEKDAPYVEGEAKLPPPRGALGVGFRLFGWAVDYERFKPDHKLGDGERVGRLTVIHTPGHTPGSICLFDEKTHTLFSGDALLSSGDGSTLKPPSASFSLDPDQALGSLKRLAALDIENVCPGHGGPVVGGASEKLRSLLDGLARH